MINENYKKMADININREMKTEENVSVSYSVNFTPTYAILFVERINNAYVQKFSYDTRKGLDINDGSSNIITLTLVSIDSEKIVIYKKSNNTSKYVLRSILLIE